MSKSFVYFGNEQLATGVSTTTPILHSIINNGYNLRCIVVNKSTITSRKNSRSNIDRYAKELNTTIVSIDDTNELIEHLSDLHADFAVLAAYGKIIPQKLIDLFPHGIINIHPSLLPKHRGPTPIESVLLQGETETGVSLMQLVKAMDAGPVYAQRSVRIDYRGLSKQTLCDELSKLASTMVVEHLPAILDGTLQPTEQNHAEATYDSKITKQNGVIDWTKTADMLGREIIAYQGWPRSRTTLGDTEVIITKARAESLDFGKPGEINLALIGDGVLAIQTGSGTIFVESLVPAGKKEMDVKSYLAGYKSRLR